MRLHDYDKDLGEKVEKLYAELDKLTVAFGVCKSSIDANKLFTLLICDGSKPRFTNLSDSSFKNIACSALKSSTLNLLPDDDICSYMSIATDKEILEKLDRNGLEEALDRMLGAREYKLSDEVVWYAINISLTGLYNFVGDNLRKLGDDIKGLPESPDKEVLLGKFRAFEEDTKATILVNKKRDIDDCQKMCIESFLKNIHDKPDDNLGFDPQHRLNMVIDALRGYDTILDLRGMDLSRYFNKIDISNTNILFTVDQEEEYLTRSQRRERSEIAFGLVSKGDVDELEQECLRRGKDIVNVANSLGRTPLMLACVSLQIDMVRKLLELGANPNAKTSNGWKIIETILLSKDDKKESIIKLLISHGADISELHIAAGAIDLTTTNTIYAPDSLNKRVNGFGPIHFAAANSNIANLGWLLRKGADINLLDDNGCTAVFTACEEGNKEVVSFLLEEGADYTIKYNGKSALGTAIRRGYDDIAEELLKRGAILDSVAEKAITEDKRKRFVGYMFISEIAKLNNCEAREVQNGTVLQQELIGLVGIKTVQTSGKMFCNGVAIECYINFSTQEELCRFNNYYVKYITSCSIPLTEVDQVHFEFDGSMLYKELLPKLKQEREEEKGRCLMM